MLDNEIPSKYSPPELNDIISSIWSFKIYIFALCAAATIISSFIAINTPNAYRADALLASTESLNGQNSTMPSQLSGLASLAGLGNLDNKKFKTEVAQAKILTKDFLYAFIDRYDLLAKILAANEWNQETGRLIYDEETYNESNNTFLLPEGSNLTWLAYKKISKNLTIENEKSGLITLSYEHVSPEVAKFIVDNLINDINKLMQSVDIEQADKSILYLNEKLAQTKVADMKVVFYRLIEEQTKNKMLTEIKSEYIFTTIDPAVVAEEKAGPKRALIVIVSVILAGFLGCFIALFRFYKVQ